MKEGDLVKEPSVDQIIKKAVEKSFNAISQKTNEDEAKIFDYYSATEKILYNYPKLVEIVSDEAKYTTTVHQEKSKSITHFSPNVSYKDPEEAEEEHELERQRSFYKTKGQLDSIKVVLSHFESDPRYPVIEMYYFNYDSSGKPRKKDSKRLSFPEIAEKLTKPDGNHPDEKTVRRWRSQLVSDISFAFFGVAAALSNSLTRVRKGQKTSE